MSVELNKRAFRRFHEQVLLKGDWDVIDEVVQPHVVSHNPLPGQAGGAAGLKLALADFRQAFPDLQSNATHVVAEKDWLVCRFEASATHRGTFMGFAPTGQRFEYEEMVMVRFEQGRIAEHWAVADTLQMMEKMGAIAFT